MPWGSRSARAPTNLNALHVRLRDLKAGSMSESRAAIGTRMNKLFDAHDDGKKKGEF